MTLEEKLATMEQIWDGLCQHQNVQSPDWHRDVLQIREESRLAGQEQPMDWQDAEKAIYQRTQKKENPPGSQLRAKLIK